MTLEEFKNVRWGVDMKATVSDQVYNIVSVDFETNLVGLEIEGNEDEIDWISYRHVQLNT